MAGRVKQCFKRFLKRTGIRKGLIGGVLVLLLVDLIWVGSAALSRFLYTTESYPKPLFTTYFKTSLFSIYLTAFIFWRPWQRLCVRVCVRGRRNVRVCRCGEGSVCTCGHSQDQEPLLSLDTDTDHTQSDPSDNEHSSEEHHDLLYDSSQSVNTIQTQVYTTVTSHDQAFGTDSNCSDKDTTGNGSFERDLNDENEHSNAGSECGHGYEIISHPPQCRDTSTGQSIDCTTLMDQFELDTRQPSPENASTEELSHSENHSMSNDPSQDHTGSELASSPQENPPYNGLDHTPSDGTKEEIKEATAPELPDSLSPNAPDLSSEAAACPLADYIREGRVDRPQFLTFSGSGYGSINSNSRVLTCPIKPELQVCLLGPPKFQPLGCYEVSSSDSEAEVKPTKPLSPCHDKCCKVRFKPTVEVREVKGRGAGRRLFRRLHKPQKEKWKRHELLSVWKVALLALVFGVLWFFANYLYAMALYLTTVAAVNTLSSTSGVFVMVLAALPCLSVTAGDKLTLSRCLVTLASVGGAVLVSLSPSGEDSKGSKFNPGALYALGGSVLYAVYLVLLRRVVTDHDSLDIPMFFGFVGLFDGVLLAPLVVIWHYTNIEPFQLPTSDQWTLLLVNGFVGTVLSELLWLWGVFLTSPLMGTLALALVTPLSIAYSIVVGKALFSWMFLAGAVLILLAFMGVTVLDHYGAWDPLWEAIKKLFLKARDYRSHREFRGLSRESQILITNSDAGQVYCHDYLSPS